MSGLAAARSDWVPIALSVLRIMTALLFMEHGTAKLLGFPPGTPTPALFGLLWFAGVIELVGGALLAVGLFTRPVAFLASGEMAFAYFQAHFPQNFFPLLNRGDAAVLYCFIFLFLAVAGGGSWSLDRLLARRLP